MRWEGDKGGRAPCASPWTAEKDAALCRLWPRRDLNCPEIAILIGGSATKNAVIGRARRLGLGPRSSEAKQRGQLAGAATKRARSERQRVAVRQFYRRPKNQPAPVEDNYPDEIAVDLPSRRYRPVLAAANPAFVKPERELWLYDHLGPRPI